MYRKNSSSSTIMNALFICPMYQKSQVDHKEME